MKPQKIFQLGQRKFLTVLRYLFPTRSDRVYLKQINRSGLFSRRFYLLSNPQLPRLFRIWPERHYIQIGENHGVCPCPDFSPRAYLFHNPDLPKKTKPFLHYLTQGITENRLTFARLEPKKIPEWPNFELPSKTDSQARVAVVLHIYYPEFWDEIATVLKRQLFEFDLLITITQRSDLPANASDILETQIISAFPSAQVWHVPNHGRDILPFIALVNAGVLARYDAVCKLHSKKSPHRNDGDTWRAALVAGAIGDPKGTAARLERFLANPNAGFWVADGQLYRGDQWWGINRERAIELFARADQITPTEPLCFPAGSMYWVRQDILKSMAGLNIAPADFEPEQALVDGTTAHAVERLMSWLAADLEMYESHQLD